MSIQSFSTYQANNISLSYATTDSKNFNVYMSRPYGVTTSHLSSNNILYDKDSSSASAVNNYFIPLSCFRAAMSIANISADVWFAYDIMGDVDYENPWGSDAAGKIGHLALDISSKYEYNRAIADGTVVHRGYNAGGNGLTITVRHEINGYVFYSFYAHNDGTINEDGVITYDSRISVGTIVKAGDILGTVGKTGFTKGKHTHLVVFTNPVNPETYGNEKTYGYTSDIGNGAASNKGSEMYDISKRTDTVQTYIFFDPAVVLKKQGQNIVDALSK